uniref:variable large family protein n=1 Tax=Borreliella turdi TaxID=57863 RepID=UPI001562E6DF
EIAEAVKKVNGWLEKMLKAAGDVAKAVADNDGTKIGESVANGVGADAGSVKGIATGMKGIIDAATEGGVKFEPAAVVNVDNKDAGKLFGTGAGAGADAGAGDVAKAAAAVGVVSGEQILKAIAAAAVDTTNHDGKKGDEAENAIQAAIGGGQGGEAFNDGKMGKKNDQIAAALVLRGMAKGGKFSVNDNNAKKTAKSTVESAVGKTANALVGLVKAAVETGIKTVGDAVKKAGNGAPTLGGGAAAAND